MTQETEREAFEKWHDSLFDQSAGTAVKNDYGYPQDACIQSRWQVWQARARLGKVEVDRHHPVFAFLLGEGNLEGRGFGDEPPVDEKSRRRIPFWWRKHLRDALSAQSKPVEVWELAHHIYDADKKGVLAFVWCEISAQAILSLYNVTKKEGV
jgi:hypothetical protein